MSKMNYKRHFLFGMCIIFILCFLASTVTAYNIEGNGVCNCNTCADCTNALNDGTNCANTIKLSGNINSAGTCIDYPSGGTNKIFDGQNHTIIGNGTGYGIILWSGRYNNTIQNCAISNFGRGFRSTSNNNITLTDNTFQSYAYFYGTGNDITVENNNFSGSGSMLRFNYADSVGTDIIVRNNTFSDIVGDGILFTTVNYENVIIQGNDCSNISGSGISVRGTNVLIGGDEESEENTISSTTYAISASGSEITIENNIVNSSQRAISGGGTNVTISGNTITGVSITYGISTNAVGTNIKIINNILGSSSSASGILMDVHSDNSLVNNNTLTPPYFIGMQIRGDNITVTNNTVLTDGTVHGGVYLIYDSVGGLVQYNDLWGLDFSCHYGAPPHPISGSDYVVRDNDLGRVELKGGRNNTIIYNNITSSLSAAGSYCNNDVYGNNISHNNFTTSGNAIIFGSNLWASYNNTISSNTFNSANNYAIKLYNSTNNTIEDNNATSSQNFVYLYSTTSNNKGCGNLGTISDLGTNYVSNVSQACYIWGEENLDNIGRLACNKTYIIGIDFQPDYFSLRTSGLTLKDKNLNNMMFLQAYPSNASLNVTLTSWNSALKKYDEVGIGTYLKYTINASEGEKNYTVSIYADSNDTKMQTFYIISNSSGYIAYNTSGFGYDRYTEIIPIAEPIPAVIVVSVVGAVVAGGAYVIRKWKKKIKE